MRNFLLGLIALRPMSLYELHAAFAGGLGHIYAASYGAIHRALTQLLREGAIVDAPDAEPAPRNRRRYTVTEDGRRTLHGWMTGPAADEPEAGVLARVFLLGSIEDPAVRLDLLRRLRDVARAHLAALLAIPAGDPAGLAAHYRTATLTQGREAGAAFVRWLDGLVAHEERGTAAGRAVGPAGARSAGPPAGDPAAGDGTLP